MQYTKEMKLNFGKYKTMILEDVAKENPSYIDWCLRNVSFFSISKKTYKYLIKNVIKNYKFSNESVENLLDENKNYLKKSIYDYQDSEPDYYRLQQLDSISYLNYGDSDRLLDECEAIGCDPQDLIQNLD